MNNDPATQPSPSPDAAEPPQTSFLSPFKHTLFRKMWTANLASSFGSLIQMTGASWMMTTLTQSADTVALVQASTAFPLMFFSLLSGAIADNFQRRSVMLTANWMLLLISATLVLVTYLGIMTPTLLLSFTFLIGCGGALSNPSWQATVGDLVPRHDLASAVTLNSVGFNLSRSAGPAVGGIIMAAFGVIATFTANCLSYLGIIYVLTRWQPPGPASKLPREQIGGAMWAGIRYVSMSPNIGKVLVRAFAFGFTASAVLALLPIVARVLLNGKGFDYGIMLGAFGLGGVIGATANAQLRRIFTTETITRLGFLSFALSAFIIATSTHRSLTNMALLLSGASWVVTLSLFNVTVQLSAPRWVVGRALALYQTCTFAGIGGGSWIWGAVAGHHGSRFALYCSAAALIGGGVIGFLLPLPKHSTLNLDPLNRWKEPEVPKGLTSRSGPIIIEVDYRIDERDIPRFLENMEKRRQIRVRDGARNWRLKRSLHETDLWTMSYQFPTWMEYVRHNSRTTQADASVGEAIDALHKGGEPVIRRMIERQANWTPNKNSKPRTQMPPA